MRIFYTTSEFVWKQMARPGIPFLCNREMELVAEPNRYLLHVAAVRGRTSSPRTWVTYGLHLYEFFAFLEENELRWDRVSQTEIAVWRDFMLQRGCNRSTVNQRLRCIHAFYRWSQQEKVIPTVPFSTQDIWVSRPQGFLGHVDASGGRLKVTDLTLPTHTAMPQFLTMDKAIQFLEAATLPRLRLMGYLALLTGMRREEIVCLDYRVVPNPAGNDPDKQLPMILDSAMTRTKGSKSRTVMLPYDLAVALWTYFVCEWPKLNSAHRRKHHKDTTRLFLSTGGDELCVRYLNNAFVRLSIRTGIRCHPHMLRHTYGTYELLRMMEKKTKDFALMWVRDRMGHTSINITEKYIHAVDLIQNDDIDGYQIEVCEALRRVH